MTNRDPALEKLDALYRMTTGKDLPPLPPGNRKSIINSIDIGGDFDKTAVPEDTIEEPGVDIQPTPPPKDEMPVSEGLRHWMNVCETPRIIGDGGTTNQRPRTGQPTRTQTQTTRPTNTTRRTNRPNDTRNTTPQPQRRIRYTVVPGVAQRTLALIERNVQTVQAKLVSEGLGQLQTAARIEFCYLQNTRASGMFWFTDYIQMDLRYPPYTYVLFHELGHRFHLRKRENIYYEGEIDRQIRGWYNLGMRDSTYMPTNYARTNHMEFWAECFAHYMSGTLRNARLRAWVKATIVAFRIVTRR